MENAPVLVCRQTSFMHVSKRPIDFPRVHRTGAGDSAVEGLAAALSDNAYVASVDLRDNESTVSVYPDMQYIRVDVFLDRYLGINDRVFPYGSEMP